MTLGIVFRKAERQFGQILLLKRSTKEEPEKSKYKEAISTFLHQKYKLFSRQNTVFVKSPVDTQIASSHSKSFGNTAPFLKWNKDELFPRQMVNCFDHFGLAARGTFELKFFLYFPHFFVD